jgi:hypothetical protein
VYNSKNHIGIDPQITYAWSQFSYKISKRKEDRAKIHFMAKKPAIGTD